MVFLWFCLAEVPFFYVFSLGLFSNVFVMQGEGSGWCADAFNSFLIQPTFKIYNKGGCGPYGPPP